MIRSRLKINDDRISTYWNLLICDFCTVDYLWHNANVMFKNKRICDWSILIATSFFKCNCWLDMSTGTLSLSLILQTQQKNEALVSITQRYIINICHANGWFLLYKYIRWKQHLMYKWTWFLYNFNKLSCHVLHNEYKDFSSKKIWLLQISIIFLA